MKNTSSSTLINLYYGHTCAYCGENSAKKYVIVFKHRYKAKVHAHCIDKLGGFENTRTWLENHVVFLNPKEFYFEVEK